MKKMLFIAILSCIPAHVFSMQLRKSESYPIDTTQSEVRKSIVKVHKDKRNQQWQLQLLTKYIHILKVHPHFDRHGQLNINPAILHEGLNFALAQEGGLEAYYEIFMHNDCKSSRCGTGRMEYPSLKKLIKQHPDIIRRFLQTVEDSELMNAALGEITGGYKRKGQQNEQFNLRPYKTPSFDEIAHMEPDILMAN